jgi:hypothetical protein
MKRDQQNQEVLACLLEVLVSEGIITQQEKKYIKSSRDFGELKELADGLKERRE